MSSSPGSSWCRRLKDRTEAGCWFAVFFFFFQGSRLKRWGPGRLPSTALIFTQKLTLDSVPIFFRKGGVPDTEPEKGIH